MKNKTSILAGTRHLFYVLLIVVIFCGCQPQIQNETMSKEKDLFSFGIQTVEHDSCEYVLIREPSQGEIEILHKQNCKFCAERSNFKNSRKKI